MKPQDSWSMGCPSKATYLQRTSNQLMLVLVVQAHLRPTFLFFYFLRSQAKQGNSDVDTGMNYCMALLHFSNRFRSICNHEMCLTKIKRALVILPPLSPLRTGHEIVAFQGNISRFRAWDGVWGVAKYYWFIMGCWLPQLP